jgi:hypothetical protein
VTELTRTRIGEVQVQELLEHEALLAGREVLRVERVTVGCEVRVRESVLLGAPEVLRGEVEGARGLDRVTE